MALYRSIQTSFWNDPWVLELTPEQKYFYIYLLTNPNVTQCGIYEISVKQMEFETGYIKDTVFKLLTLFEKKGKIKFSLSTSEICLINFSKYNYNSSPSVMKRVNNELKEVKNKSLIQHIYGIDTVYREYIDSMDTLPIWSAHHTDTISLRKRKEKEKETHKEIPIVDEKLNFEILSFFGFKKEINNDKYQEVIRFLNSLSIENQLEEFRKQFSAYAEYKKASREKIHGFKAFLGSSDKKYQDGGWCAENWSFKLQNTQNNGVPKQNFKFLKFSSLEEAKKTFSQILEVSNEQDQAIRNQGGYELICPQKGYTAKIEIGNQIYLGR